MLVIDFFMERSAVCRNLTKTSGEGRAEKKDKKKGKKNLLSRQRENDGARTHDPQNHNLML